MGWAAMVSEFPDSGQRYAVCERYWAEGPQTKIEPNPCWSGYEAIGLKPDGSPNCVPVKTAKLYHLKEAAKKQIDISFNWCKTKTSHDLKEAAKKQVDIHFGK
jgi:hypothetical protein